VSKDVIVVRGCDAGSVGVIADVAEDMDVNWTGGMRVKQRRRSRCLQTRASTGSSDYAVTKEFPREELFSLTDQTRRVVGFVGMNLMEGALRLGTKENRQFVGIARGSAGEVCYQLLLARDLNYISSETNKELRSGYDRVIQMLSRLSQSLSQRKPRAD